MDVFSKAKRSQVMAAIRYRGNRSTERIFGAMLRRFRISGWKLHCSHIPGRPDFYFPERKTVFLSMDASGMAAQNVFKHPRKTHPTGRRRSGGNRRRDRRVTRALRHEGVKVIRLWEHDLEKR